MSNDILEQNTIDQSVGLLDAPVGPAEPQQDFSSVEDLLEQVEQDQLTDLQQIQTWYSKNNFKLKQIDWPVFMWMTGIHVGALAAPFFFTWQALGVCVVLHWLTCSIGICLGYHRYLSHRSMKLAWPAEFATTLCGILAGEGTPLNWAAIHRMHHQRSDLEGDPHSPLEGKWWSHLLWMFIKHPTDQQKALQQRYVPDLMSRPILQFFDKTFAFWLFGTAGLMYYLGGWPMLLWGVCVRMTFAYHSTWFVNSATHLWGYRNYETTDQSRNLWWVAILAYGEGWHNNHHAHPAVAPAGHKWWEFDITWWSIRALRALGLAYDVKDKIPEAKLEPPVESLTTAETVG